MENLSNCFCFLLLQYQLNFEKLFSPNISSRRIEATAWNRNFRHRLVVFIPKIAKKVTLLDAQVFLNMKRLHTQYTA